MAVDSDNNTKPWIWLTFLTNQVAIEYDANKVFMHLNLIYIWCQPMIAIRKCDSLIDDFHTIIFMSDAAWLTDKIFQTAIDKLA